MNKIAVIYWSGTGNTEEMANAIAEGLMCQGSPNDECLEACRNLGKQLS